MAAYIQQMNVNKKIGAVLGAPKANLCRLI